jgi:uncharacterized protein (TIGR03435 family)
MNERRGGRGIGFAERFHLAMHRETRNRPGYELVVAKGGPKLKQFTGVTDPARDFRPARMEAAHDGFPKLPATGLRRVVHHDALAGRDDDDLSRTIV